MDSHWSTIRRHHQQSSTRGERRSSNGGTTLRFERRRQARLGLTGSVIATFRDTDGRVGLVRLDLIDASHDGLGVRTAMQLSAGTVVTLHAPACGEPNSTGRVVGCTPDGTGFRIGLSLGVRLAA